MDKLFIKYRQILLLLWNMQVALFETLNIAHLRYCLNILDHMSAASFKEFGLFLNFNNRFKQYFQSKNTSVTTKVLIFPKTNM